MAATRAGVTARGDRTRRTGQLEISCLFEWTLLGGVLFFCINAM